MKCREPAGRHGQRATLIRSGRSRSVTPSARAPSHLALGARSGPDVGSLTSPAPTAPTPTAPTPTPLCISWGGMAMGGGGGFRGAAIGGGGGFRGGGDRSRWRFSRRCDRAADFAAESAAEASAVRRSVAVSVAGSARPRSVPVSVAPDLAGVVSASVVRLSAGAFASPASVAVVGAGAEVLGLSWDSGRNSWLLRLLLALEWLPECQRLLSAGMCCRNYFHDQNEQY